MLPVALAFVLLVHFPYFSLPYFWDELGQFVPASLDLYQHGQWVPASTLPNVHPPGLMAYLTAVWSVTGYSVVVTRIAILCLAAGAVTASWWLAIGLGLSRVEAWWATGLLAVSPLFYSQSMMVQLELPALLFTVLALGCAVRGWWGWAVVACTALVLMKETGAVLPVLLALWLVWRERQWRRAVWFCVPLVALAVWLLILRTHTGQVLGNQEFARYNLYYPLHPVRLGAALLRRGYFLVLSSFHWIGTLALLTWVKSVRNNWQWQLAGAFLVLHTVAVSVTGGATLERYLLPVLPILYGAMIIALRGRSVAWRAALVIGVALSNWILPLYPFPFEDNLAFVDFVHLQQEGARYVEEHPTSRVATAWPLTDALRRPEFGYVGRAYAGEIVPLEDFRMSAVAQVPRTADTTLLVYTRTWDGPLLHSPLVHSFLTRFYNYEPAATPTELEAAGWRLQAQFNERGQAMRVYRRAY